MLRKRPRRVFGAARVGRRLLRVRDRPAERIADLPERLGLRDLHEGRGPRDGEPELGELLGVRPEREPAAGAAARHVPRASAGRRFRTTTTTPTAASAPAGAT